MTISAVLGNKGGEVIAAEAGQTVAEIVALLAEKRIGAVPVLRDGEVVGIFSERDVIYGLRRDAAGLLDETIEKVMTAPAITIETGDSVLVALSLMTRRRIRHLPVVDHGKLVGFVSIGDLVKFRMDGIEREAAALRDYIQTA